MSNRAHPDDRSATAAVVLAAGEGRRMGGPKASLLLGGRPTLDWVLGAVRSAKLGEIVVVLGPRSGEVGSPVDLHDVRVVENPLPRAGMARSLRLGIAALSPKARAFFVVLGDAPFVRAATYARLLAERQRSHAPIVRPFYRERPGHPVLFDRGLEREFQRIRGDEGGRRVVSAHGPEVENVPVDDPGVVIDLDTPEDLGRARWRVARRASISELARVR